MLETLQLSGRRQTAGYSRHSFPHMAQWEEEGRSPGPFVPAAVHASQGVRKVQWWFFQTEEKLIPGTEYFLENDGCIDKMVSGRAHRLLDSAHGLEGSP